MKKFKVSPKVNRFKYNGKRYSSGQIVEIADYDVERLSKCSILIAIDSKPPVVKAKKVESEVPEIVEQELAQEIMEAKINSDATGTDKITEKLNLGKRGKHGAS